MTASLSVTVRPSPNTIKRTVVNTANQPVKQAGSHLVNGIVP